MADAVADDASRAVVRCGDALHTVSLSGGRLRLVDHPDVESERILAALSGDIFAAPECLRVLRAAELARTDPRMWRALLEESPPTSRFPASLLPLALANFRSQWPGSNLGLEWDALELPTSMRRSFCIAIATEWLEGWDALQEQIRSGVRYFVKQYAMAQLNRCCPPATTLHVAVAPGAPSIAIGGEQTTVTVQLEPSWMIDVWSRELAEVDRSFVLQATMSGDRATVLAASILDARTVRVRPETARRVDGRWTLRPSDD